MKVYSNVSRLNTPFVERKLVDCLLFLHSSHFLSHFLLSNFSIFHPLFVHSSFLFLFLLCFFKFVHWLSSLKNFRILSSFKLFRDPPLFSHHSRALEILYYLNFGHHSISLEILQCPIALEFLPSDLLMHCMFLIVIFLFCMMLIVYAYFLGCQNWTSKQAIV